MLEFEEFPKIPRLHRTCVVTEKIDGTNAQIIIGDDGSIRAASRTRLITPLNDNHGFAKWVEAHAEELIAGLGPGRHFGEWWGAGIQRRYGIAEKRFSLFNVGRWRASIACVEYERHAAKAAPPPACCHVVPVLAVGMFPICIDAAMERLRAEGSIAAPGFGNPEGVVVFHEASGALFKRTLEGDEVPKGQVA